VFDFHADAMCIFRYAQDRLCYSRIDWVKVALVDKMSIILCKLYRHIGLGLCGIVGGVYIAKAVFSFI